MNAKEFISELSARSGFNIKETEKQKNGFSCIFADKSARNPLPAPFPNQPALQVSGRYLP